MKPDCDEDGGCVGPDVYDRESGVFAIIDGEPETLATPWKESDAHLFAASPDMKLALEHVRDGHTDMDEIMAAIAKAEGRTA
jgi:hypothetical protein